MSTPTEIADALDAAADYIEVHGWCQGALSRPDGRVCLYGALLAAHSIASYDRSPLASAALVAVDLHIAGRGDSGNIAVSWNDAEGRTEFEVIDALRLAAKDVRATVVTT